MIGATALARAWYRPVLGWLRLLLPLSWLYGAAVGLRRLAYRRGWLAGVHPGVPVIVVGNITVGGTGKTPLVAALATRLRERGYRPGIVSRGYGGALRRGVQLVTPDADPAEVGDEPLLLARATACPVAVARRRVDAARRLVAQASVDVIVADDGLQHYALVRDAEIAVCDRRRGYGNGRLLPAGPLREPLRRLAAVDLELLHGADGDFVLQGAVLWPLSGNRLPSDLSVFAGRRVHALAGIGNPEGFFAGLRAAGLILDAHAFTDHHRYRPADIVFNDNAAVIMTEKDAVKCARFADARHWYLPVTAGLNAGAGARLDALFDRVLQARP